MFEKILIANRGEIACRIIGTCKKMGIASVAICSEADVSARHVRLADEAFCIGPPAANESYLQIQKIIDIALRCGAKAIHPGYGFLSENADFAEACADNGITFIGPPPGVIRTMGSKSAAKELMVEANVPVLPGYHGDTQDVSTFRKHARAMGYPVLVKAAAGGGGRGMRIVQSEETLIESLEHASQEANAFFSDGRLLIEQYLPVSRHVEVQIFSDQHGNCLALFDRDCSIQRRHQKILEEAPAPNISMGMRQEMANAAVNCAKAVGYVGAGTIEFIVDGEKFYFLEMNTRLQVEHPVTEMITRLDLVEWQIRVAAGEALPDMSKIRANGHAMEARICAEDPSLGFMPSTGKITSIEFPKSTDDVRVDTGVCSGDTMSPFYDSLVAKLIVWGRDRNAARKKLVQCLRQIQIVGIKTNIDLLHQISSSNDFSLSNISTSLLESIGRSPLPDNIPAACVAILFDKIRKATTPYGNPWMQGDNWRLNAKARWNFDLRYAENHLHVTAESCGEKKFEMDINGKTYLAAEVGPGLIQIDSKIVHTIVLKSNSVYTVRTNDQTYELTIPSQTKKNACFGLEQRVIAPIPGRVIRVSGEIGDKVIKGEPLIALEAMKMELILSAPFSGEITQVNTQLGSMVEAGQELILMAER